jgi:hypothetical protein
MKGGVKPSIVYRPPLSPPEVREELGAFDVSEKKR